MERPRKKWSSLEISIKGVFLRKKKPTRFDGETNAAWGFWVRGWGGRHFQIFLENMSPFRANRPRYGTTRYRGIEWRGVNERRQARVWESVKRGRVQPPKATCHSASMPPIEIRIPIKVAVIIAPEMVQIRLKVGIVSSIWIAFHHVEFSSIDFRRYFRKIAWIFESNIK